MIIKTALIGFIALLLTACAAPNRHSDWGVISREVQRTINR
jgi:hypothetical protein